MISKVKKKKKNNTGLEGEKKGMTEKEQKSAVTALGKIKELFASIRQKEAEMGVRGSYPSHTQGLRIKSC